MSGAASRDLTLSDEERALLVELLDNDFRNLKQEIGHTDTSTFKEELKVREATLLGLIEKLTGSRPA
jgi:hypothetical protein